MELSLNHQMYTLPCWYSFWALAAGVGAVIATQDQVGDGCDVVLVKVNELHEELPVMP